MIKTRFGMNVIIISLIVIVSCYLFCAVKRYSFCDYNFDNCEYVVYSSSAINDELNVIEGDHYISYVNTITPKIESTSIGISVVLSGADELNRFCDNFKLKQINSYVVDNILVYEYKSIMANKSVDGCNFMVAISNNQIILGYPIIFEGF